MEMSLQNCRIGLLEKSAVKINLLLLFLVHSFSLGPLGSLRDFGSFTACLRFFFFKVYLIILRERERERENIHKSGKGRERGGDRIPSRFHPVSTEPHEGLELTNCEIMT